MEHGPSWEANRTFGQSRNFPLLWKQKVRYSVHNSPSPVPVLSQMNAIHNPPPYFAKINFNTVLKSTPTYSKWSLQVFRTKFCTYLSSPPCVYYMPYTTHPPWFHQPNNILKNCISNNVMCSDLCFCAFLYSCDQCIFRALYHGEQFLGQFYCCGSYQACWFLAKPAIENNNVRLFTKEQQTTH